MPSAPHHFVRRRAFTIIESLVLLFIFSLVSIVFLETYIVGTHTIIESKNRLGATALANQKMEIIRSLDYGNIGTQTGIPHGDLQENETISVNTRSYHVHTFVQYVDDTFDGKSGGSPNDSIPTDYKRVRITVGWGNEGADQQVALFGNFSPNGIEASTGGGVLSVNVLGADGSGVSGANVQIVNAAQGISTTGSTDASGNLTLPGTPAGVQAYALTVSKSGYYTVSTAPAYPASPYQPSDLHASVVANTLNQKSIVMDRVINLTLKTEDLFGNALSGTQYSIAGGRSLGINPGNGQTVYSYNQSGTFPTSGELSLANQSYGQYTLSLTDANRTFFKLSPEGNTVNIIDAPAGANGTVKVLMLDKALGSLFVRVKSSTANTPLAGAQVKLSSPTLAYDTTLTTDQYGYAYFPTSLAEDGTGLVAGDYTLSVSASGFTANSQSVSVTNALLTKDVSLIQQ